MSNYYNDRKSITELLYGSGPSMYMIITNQQSINYKSLTQSSITSPSYSTDNIIHYNAESSRTYGGDGYCQYAQLNTPTVWGR
jgi:hypothetical protein